MSDIRASSIIPLLEFCNFDEWSIYENNLNALEMLLDNKKNSETQGAINKDTFKDNLEYALDKLGIVTELNDKNYYFSDNIGLESLYMFLQDMHPDLIIRFERNPLCSIITDNAIKRLDERSVCYSSDDDDSEATISFDAEELRQENKKQRTAKKLLEPNSYFTDTEDSSVSSDYEDHSYLLKDFIQPKKIEKPQFIVDLTQNKFINVEKKVGQKLFIDPPTAKKEISLKRKRKV